MSSPSALSRNLSQHSLLARRIDHLRACLAVLLAALPAWPLPLIHLLTLLSWRRLLRISSFHHRFERAQIVIRRTCLSSTPTRVSWIQSISSSSSLKDESSSSLGRLCPARLQMTSNFASELDHSSDRSLSSRSLRAQPRIFQSLLVFLGAGLVQHHSMATWSDPVSCSSSCSTFQS